jgi:aminomuconate-semialdehyde/2-hydroxymuconate-6-semialdehyde dehydrogenase
MDSEPLRIHHQCVSWKWRSRLPKRRLSETENAMPPTTSRILNFVDGEHREPVSRQYFDNVDPALGQPYGLVPDSDKADLDIAVAAARRAFPAWRDTAAEKRAAMLARLADLIEQRLEDFVRAECIDTGKPLWLCRTVDIPRSVANLRAFAGAAVAFAGQSFQNDFSQSYTLRQPIGVVATISPWNLPLLLFTWKLAPALAAGNCVIAKPSEVTPMTAHLLSQLVNDAGFPKGVLNILHGKGAKIGAAITTHPDIAAISFTGGTATGMEIYNNAARLFKKVSLELGGKNPTIVFEDADWKKAVEGAKTAAFANQGQVCLCGSRILVHASVYDKFKADFIEQTRTIVVGDPLNEPTRHGAMVSKVHMEKVLSYIDLAKEEGGTILMGGKRRTLEGRCGDGYFIEPTVIEGLPPTCRTNQEEIFGPVATLIPFATEDEALSIANSTTYGLSASVWTQNAERARRVASRIESGMVWINCWNVRDLDTPFGGMKKSGMGREGKWRAMEFFTDEKTVTAPR